jgi:hypothetical protein
MKSEVKDNPAYKQEAWRAYSMSELGDLVHLLHKRAGHRDDAAKKAKDLFDARAYWVMMGKLLDEAGA